MKLTVTKAWLVIAGCALLGACSLSAPPKSDTTGAAQQLFKLEPTPDRNTLQKTASGYLAALLADPVNHEVTLIKVDPAVVSSGTQNLAVTLPNGKAAQFHLRDFNTITPGIDGWVGYKPSAYKQSHPGLTSEIDSDPLYYLSLARDGEKLVGSVTVDGQLYRIDYVSPGQHALIKVDESKLPPDGEPVQDPGNLARDNTVGKVPTSARSVIRVLFVTTKQSREKRPNNRAELAKALNDANQYMANSQVAITYEAAGYVDADYDETGRSYWQQATDMMSSSQVSQQREQWRADLVSVYSTKTGACGMATVTATRSTAYSVISCAHSLAHELGHNLGAMHRHNEPANVPEYAYGYDDTVGKFHTMMHTSHGAVPYFADPRLSYQGRPLGHVELHDVARRFDERRETVENFYPPMPYKKIKNVMLELRGLPACLMVTATGALGFTDCEGNSSDLLRRQWLYNLILPSLSIESRLGGASPCLQYTKNGSAPQMSVCPNNASEAYQNYTEWNVTGGTIRFTRFFISNCLTAGLASASPVLDFCKGGNEQQWRAVD